MHGLAFWIAMRCLWRGGNRYVRLVNWISLLGLGIGVSVLTVVVSVMNGFAEELRSRILGAVPHALLTGQPPPDPAQAAAMPGVVAAHRYFEAAGMAVSGETAAPVVIYALDPPDELEAAAASALPGLVEQMIEGDLTKALRQPDGVVMGLPLARQLGLFLGDDLLLILPEGTQRTARPRFKRHRLHGLFLMGAEFDYNLAVVSRLAFSERERRRMGVDGVRVVLDDPMQAQRFAAAWREGDNAASVETWTETYGELFQAVRIEKALMFLILLLVVAVAGFNIVAGQTMVVDGKRADIAVLRTLGATGALIRRIFLLQGLIVASLGIALGLALGVAGASNVGPAVAQVEAWLDFRLLEGSYFDVVPSRLRAADLAVIGGASWLLCLLAAWLPARRAAAQPPVQGLHLR